MPDYTKTVIYKIVCNNPEVKEIYVGSTCNFAKRKCDHKSTTHNSNSPKYELYLYRYIRYYGGWQNWSMIPIRQYPCVDKMSKLIKEKRTHKIMCECGCSITKKNIIKHRRTKKHKVLLSIINKSKNNINNINNINKI